MSESIVNSQRFLAFEMNPNGDIGRNAQNAATTLDLTSYVFESA